MGELSLLTAVWGYQCSVPSSQTVSIATEKLAVQREKLGIQREKLEFRRRR